MRMCLVRGKPSISSPKTSVETKRKEWNLQESYKLQALLNLKNLKVCQDYFCSPFLNTVKLWR
jgi:hypothetical protein